MERLISDFGYNDKKFYLELGRYLAAEMGFNVYGPFCTSVDKFAWDKSGKQIRMAYERLDIGTNWRYNDKLMIRARVENISDEKDFGSTKEGEPINDEGKIGRAFWLGIDYKI